LGVGRCITPFYLKVKTKFLTEREREREREREKVKDIKVFKIDTNFVIEINCVEHFEIIVAAAETDYSNYSLQQNNIRSRARMLLGTSRNCEYQFRI